MGSGFMSCLLSSCFVAIICLFNLESEQIIQIIVNGVLSFLTNHNTFYVVFPRDITSNLVVEIHRQVLEGFYLYHILVALIFRMNRGVNDVECNGWLVMWWQTL